jgi:uncharacterized protein YybS (DUF2232 family)
MAGSDSGARVNGQVLVLAALAITLFAASGYVPVIGILVSLLAPTPILLVVLRHGWRKGLLALGLSTLCLALLLGSLQSLLFIVEYGVMAIAMAEAIRRRWSVEKAVALSTIAPFLASGLFLTSLLSSPEIDINVFKQHFEENLEQALRPYLTEGDQAIKGDLRDYIQEAIGVVVQTLPALFLLSTAVAALLNYSVTRLVWRRIEGPPLFPAMSLAQWQAPDACVWVLIGSGLAYFLPIPALQTLGLNLLLLVGFMYLLQGLAILTYYLHKITVPPIFRSLAYIFLVIQPLLLLGVAAFGLFDLWFDFRRTRNKREESQ